MDKSKVINMDKSNGINLKVLFVDAWANGEGGWNWNDRYHVGDVTILESELTSTRKILKCLRATGLLAERSKGKVTIDSHNEMMDGILIEVLERKTGMPLMALSNTH